MNNASAAENVEPCPLCADTKLVPGLGTKCMACREEVELPQAVPDVKPPLQWHEPSSTDPNNWPASIWLQRGEECAANGCDGPHDDGDTTWCKDKINAGDVKYVRADLVEKMK